MPIIKISEMNMKLLMKFQKSLENEGFYLSENEILLKAIRYGMKEKKLDFVKTIEKGI